MSALPSSLPHTIKRTIIIRATPAIVFRYFTDSARWASWWGAGSTIDARAGGLVLIRNPGGVEASGEVLELSPPKRIVFTYGYASGNPIPAGGSRVTIDIRPDPAGTRLELRHELASASARDEHVQGWRFQLSVFANRVSDEANAGVGPVVDTWFNAWAEPDAARRASAMEKIAAPGILFNDRFSTLETLPELLAHITAAQRFMPGVRMQRAGDVRHCQGMVLADWRATASDGAEMMRGTNVFVFGPSGHVESVTGFSAAGD